MKPREKGGVVDNKMNVYGVKGLKIADLSICPENLGTNTYSVRSAAPLLSSANSILTRFPCYQSALLCGEKCASVRCSPSPLLSAS